MRRGFTMIELIFVIVILGVLASVALPKFVGMSEQAQEGKLKAFIGTLNRTVGPTLWSKSITDGNNGAINGGSYDLTTYVDIPDGNSTAPNLTRCQAATTSTIGHAQSNAVVEYSAANVGKNYFVICRDGNVSNSPVFGLYNDTDGTWVLEIQ